ncbi:hypothetical protein GCM10020258_44710 [Sphingomonas yabuuchiae]
MKRTTRYLAVSMAAAGLALGVTAGRAQLVPSLPGMPSLPGGLPSVGRGISSLADPVIDRVDAASRATVRQLEQVRRATFAQLVRDHPDAIALDPMGFPARAGEVVVDAPSDALLATVGRLGFTVIERDDVLGVGFVRLRVPPGQSLKAALGILQKLGGEVSADQLHLPSGAGAPAALTAVQGGTGRGTMVGVIDGGAEGAAMARVSPRRSARQRPWHGGRLADRREQWHPGALPGARIASADVYGSDPAGGNATAIAKALGWLVEQRVSVATISLVGPANPLLARVVAAAQKRGLIIVAAVGNNGPAAPPAYPASYLGVIAVTGVDGRGRPLIEAGRASHLDYAAPGADMLAAGVGGRRFKVRGTSFAAPLVAGRVAAAYPSLDPGRIRAALADVDAEAKKMAGEMRKIPRPWNGLRRLPDASTVKSEFFGIKSEGPLVVSSEVKENDDEDPSFRHRDPCCGACRDARFGAVAWRRRRPGRWWWPGRSAGWCHRRPDRRGERYAERGWPDRPRRNRHGDPDAWLGAWRPQCRSAPWPGDGFG